MTHDHDDLYAGHGIVLGTSISIVAWTLILVGSAHIAALFF